jgi:hypothetical protein
MTLTIKSKEQVEAEQDCGEDVRRAMETIDEAVHMALVATKAAVRSLKGSGKVTSRTPTFKFKKNGTVVIKLNLEVKPQP